MLDALRLGAHQLLSMRVPPHAAISTTVDLVRARVGTGAGGLHQRRAPPVCRAATSTSGSAGSPPTRASRRAVRRARLQPPAVGRRGAARDAVGWPELDALLAADNEPPRVTLVARPGRSTRDELPGEPTPYSPYGVVLEGGDPGAVPAVAEGRAGVQDEGSQLVALALAARPGRRPRTSAGSTCAPDPAARPALLAALASGRGAAPGRQRAAAAPGRLVRPVPRPAPTASLGVVAADGTAPTVATAGLRPGPRRRAVHRPGRAAAAARGALAAQARRPARAWCCCSGPLVGSALDLVRPGGVVLYATCSPVLAETSSVVGSVLARPAPTPSSRTRPPLLRRRARRRGPGARHRPALAAPARHRRDVHGAAPQALSVRRCSAA